jgi:hypothetical protein
MEKYQKPTAEIIQFKATDVISASACADDDPGDCYAECVETPEIPIP